MNDVGEYCRQVEDYLTRVNAGHIVRIVGPGFELVRGWAEESVPLSIVFRGIEMKAERHRHGASTRPLRIEFCASDVRAVFDQWRRAVGLHAVGIDVEQPERSESQETSEIKETKAPSLGKHLDRAIDRLSKFCSREDLAAPFRDQVDRLLQSVAALRESSARARGAARDEAIATLTTIDQALRGVIRAHAPHEWLVSVGDEAARDLAPFRARLADDAWVRSVDITVDRLLRDRYGLPHLDL